LDVFTGLLPFLPGIPFSVALVVVYRLWLSAVKELRNERLDHRHTQVELDVERDNRRLVENKMDELGQTLRSEIRDLRAEIGRLRKQLDEVTAP
jgi:hypothetical protein